MDIKRKIHKFNNMISACVYICYSEVLIKLHKPLRGDYRKFKLVASCFIAKFKKFKEYNDKMNVLRLKNQQIIRCGFVVYSSSMWNFDKLYYLFKNHEAFSVNIIVAHVSDTNIDKESAESEYSKTVLYFKNKHLEVFDAKRISALDYDLLFYLTPFALVEEQFHYYNIPLSVGLLHSSYSYMLAGNMSKLKKWLYHFALAYYTDTNYYKQLIEKTDLYTRNAKYLGFPKMDQFYTAEFQRRSTKKIIIYAPHHSVNYTEYKSATFEDNYLDILELAKQHADSTYWIYKPHPLLRPHSVVAGIFDSVEEYDRYVDEWNNLENADVVTSGEYFSLFKESDAMITDSVSFLAEYQFTHNPLLLLESGKEKYNDFGNSILDILYKCPGDDISGIESFIMDIVSEKDDMKEKRMAFFEDNLSYRKNSMSANYRIFKDILEFTGKEEKNEE